MSNANYMAMSLIGCTKTKRLGVVIIATTLLLNFSNKALSQNDTTIDYLSHYHWIWLNENNIGIDAMQYAMEHGDTIQLSKMSYTEFDDMRNYMVDSFSKKNIDKYSLERAKFDSLKNHPSFTIDTADSLVYYPDSAASKQWVTMKLKNSTLCNLPMIRIKRYQHLLEVCLKVFIMEV
jgi:hypothetical protein